MRAWKGKTQKEYSGRLLNRRQRELLVSCHPRNIYIIHSLQVMWKVCNSLGSKRLKPSNPSRWMTQPRSTNKALLGQIIFSSVGQCPPFLLLESYFASGFLLMLVSEERGGKKPKTQTNQANNNNNKPKQPPPPPLKHFIATKRG